MDLLKQQINLGIPRSLTTLHSLGEKSLFPNLVFSLLSNYRGMILLQKEGVQANTTKKFLQPQITSQNQIASEYITQMSSQLHLLNLPSFQTLNSDT